jgi:hypothetical protein
MARNNTLEYIYKAVDQMSATVKRIEANQNKFNKTVKKSNRVLTAFKRTSGRVLAAATSKFTAFFALIASGFGFKSIIDAGTSFEDAMADISAITGETGADLLRLEKRVIGMSKEFVIAQDQVALTFAQVASAKSELLKDPKALAEVTEQVLLLANAAGIEVSEAMSASVGALNQFGEGADQAGRFVNVMAAGAKVGASLVGQTAEALVDAGTAAADAGLSFEQTNALLQVLAKSEVKGARAGVALRNFLAIIGEVAEGAIDPKKIGLFESLKALEKAGLTNTQLTKIFGRETKNAASFLIKNIDLIKQWEKEITGTNEAQRQANVRLNTTSTRMRSLGISIKQKLIDAFDRLQPKIELIVEEIKKWIDSITAEDIDMFAEKVELIAENFVLVSEAIIDSIKFAKEFFSSTEKEKTVGISVVEAFEKVDALNKIKEKLNNIFGTEFEIKTKIKVEELKGPKIGAIEIPEINTAKILEFKLPKINEFNSSVNVAGTMAQEIKTTIDVNVNAPEGTVRNIETRTQGNANVGVNAA